MFQFGGFPTLNYGFIQRSHGITREGFPHSDICGSQAICASPQLFAAYRVLLRLLMPRHSPCALLSLNFFPSLLHEFRKSVLFLLIAVYCFQYYFALFFGKTIIFFTQFSLSFLLSCFFCFRILFLAVYRVLDLLSPILLSLSPRQFVCRYTLTISY